MALKRKLHHWLVRLRHIKTWQLVIVLLLCALVAAYSLRQNNLEMIELRNMVKKADEDKGDVRGALEDLQRYVVAHMNTDLGNGVFLEHGYQRANEEAVKAAINQVDANGQWFKEVEGACWPAYTQSNDFQQYLQCSQDKLAALAPGQDPLLGLKAPPADLFRYNFASPVWSADFAGFSTLATLLVAALIVLRLVGYITLRLLLRMHR